MSDEFYVGYLPLPRGYKRFLVALVTLLVVGVLAASVLMTSQQNDPGKGQWDLSNTVTFTGVLRSEPYAILAVPGDDGRPTRNILLVTMGKIGGSGLTLPPEGGTLSVRGYPISRGGDTVLLAVENPLADVSKESDQSVPQWSPQDLSPTTLSGQIIDPKCYFGAMKPGEGKVHKACATLCISGGIPPMFMTTDSTGERTCYLLLDEDGRGIVGVQLETLKPFIADPVRIPGRLGRIGSLLVFRIDTAKIERL
jgi:hypothetical protein